MKFFFRQTRGRRPGCIPSMKARNSEHSWEQLANSSTTRKKTKVRSRFSLIKSVISVVGTYVSFPHTNTSTRKRLLVAVLSYVGGTDTIQIINDIQPHCLEHKWKFNKFLMRPQVSRRRKMLASTLSPINSRHSPTRESRSSSSSPWSTNRTSTAVVVIWRSLTASSIRRTCTASHHTRSCSAQISAVQEPRRYVEHLNLLSPRVVQAQNCRNYWHMRTLRAR